MELAGTPGKHLLHHGNLVLHPQLLIESGNKFFCLPVHLVVIISIFRIYGYPPRQGGQEGAQLLRTRKVFLIKAILGEVFPVVVHELGDDNSIGVFLHVLVDGVWMNAGKVGHVELEFPSGYVENWIGRAVAAGEFILSQPGIIISMMVASGVMENKISQAFSTHFASFHHEVHVHEHLPFGDEPFSEHEEGDPQHIPQPLR